MAIRGRVAIIRLSFATATDSLAASAAFPVALRVKKNKKHWKTPTTTNNPVSKQLNHQPELQPDARSVIEPESSSLRLLMWNLQPSASPASDPTPPCADVHSPSQ